LQKLAAMSTDEASSMIRKNHRFLSLCKQNEQFPDFIALCAKMLIANLIRSLRRHLFRSQLEDNDSKYEDL